MRDGKQAVRCPDCEKLLAMERNNGILEIKIGRRVVLTAAASLLCPRCGRWIKKGLETGRDT